MSKKGVLIKAGILLLLILITLGIILKLELYKKINIEEIQVYINSFGNGASVVYILFFALRTLLIIFPFTVVVVFGGSLFGLAKGFLFSMIAVFIAGNIAFFISRYAGRDYVRKILKGKVKQLDDKVEEHGFRIIFFMRITFIFPFDILNYAAGLSKVKYKDFILGMILGIIPDVFALTYLGSNFGNPLSYKFIAAIVLVIITIALPLLINKKKKII